MGTPVESPTGRIDSLAARTIIQEYDTFSMVIIPEYSTLSQAERAEITLKARDVTPPIDQEEEDEESRALEAQARQELENDGCPTCYPPNLIVPLQNVPEEHQPIVDYWKSFPGTGDVVLCAQRLDWQRFRAFQRKARRGFQETSFHKFEDLVRERRRRHGLDGSVRLVLQPEQQSRLEQWVEFQNYQLMHLERLEENRDKVKRRLDEVQEKAANADDVVGSQRAARDESAVQQNLETAKWEVERHKVFLRWIEQQRLAMDPGHPTRVEEDGGGGVGDGGAAHVASTRVRRGRQPKISVVLGNDRISKMTPPKQRMQTRKLKALGPRPAIENLRHQSLPRQRAGIPRESRHAVRLVRKGWRRQDEKWTPG
ncbi:hypothetical protein SPI_07389 [Niveomyces insectorum RCEF 264]|uniref:Uncharacterized protein n=1 Tax=Niveomyces insectorum RCEF 264 TaxID=1081102 RepID=A0A167PTF2_9HYPO|nr:hypothetical protein SPI_07389 [Niveomyces insectorum RCEF 264]